MSYVCYHIKHKNLEGTQFGVKIFDQDTSGPIAYTDLEGAGNPMVPSIMDSQEDRFNPIAATQLEINFNSTGQYDLNTFLDGYDGRWYVEAWRITESNIIFKGYLSLNDLRETFGPPPNVVTLTAVDRLGMLKNEALTKDDSSNPKGEYSIMQYIAWALKKTGLSLPIKLLFNLKVASQVDDAPLSTVYADAKAFEKEISVSEDCYTVLEKIMQSFKCTLTQIGGEWWIIRRNELDSQDLTVHSFDADGVYISSTTSSGYNKTILNTEDDSGIEFIDRETTVSAEWKHKHVKETYNYEYAKEVVDNIDFSRGSGPLPVALPAGELAYSIEDWTARRNFPASGTPVITPYIKRKFVDGYEKERYVVIPATNTSSNTEYIESNPVPIEEKDKFTFSVDFSFNNNISGGGFTTDLLALVYLKSGSTVYSLKADGSWVSGYNTITYQWQPATVDERIWQTINVAAKPVPISGDLYICLLQSSVYGQTNDTRFQNLRFDYQPFINNSYQTYNGQYWKVSQSVPDKAIREEEVYFSDSPRKLFKGALLTFDFVTGKYSLAGNWIDRDGQEKPLGYFQAFDVWHQYKNVRRVFDASLMGLTPGEDLPGIIHRYTLGDESPHTNERLFNLLYDKMNIRDTRWSGYLVEVPTEKTFTDTVEFKYIENR